MNMKFLVNRLFRMSPSELVYRSYKKLYDLLELYNIGKMSNLHNGYKDIGKLNLPDEEDSSVKKIADMLCENRMDLFALKNMHFDNMNYHKDYKSSKIAPDQMIGKKIDYRDCDTIGDIKYIWETNRHLYLTALSYEYYVTKDIKYLQTFETLLSEWFQQNPFLMGVNWTSSLELGIRLINWTLCWHLVSQNISKELRDRWVLSIYQHTWFIHRNYSRFSSANNHLIGEAAGQFIACTALPQFRDTKKWQMKAYNILVEECYKQNYADGVNCEQAISYQQFVLDFLILSLLIGKTGGITFPEAYSNRIEKMLEYVSVVEDYNGNIPHIGDEDDGFVINLGQNEYGTYRSLLNTGAFLFSRKDFLTDNREIDFKTKFLLNLTKVDTKTQLNRKVSISPNFNSGGYYILGSDFGKAVEQKMVFDCGPLGYLSLAAHGHADALSFTFSAGGCPIFVDPGTYAYHNNKKWRNYFRSTAAHNTICIDQENQSIISGNFMWGKKANSQKLIYEDYLRVKGMHDGYMRFNDKVMHTREVCYDKNENIWRIIDEIGCNGNHDIAMYFHLHPDCTITRMDEHIRICFNKGICLLAFQTDMEVNIYHGNEILPLGWYSSSYDTKVPTNTIRLSKKIYASTRIETKIKICY